MEKRTDSKPQEARAPERREQPGYYPGFSTLSQKSYWDGVTRKLVLSRLEPPKPLRFFAEAEAVTMLAVVGRILPQEDRTEARQIPILPGIDERLASDRIDGYRFEDMPSDQEAYRLAVRAFNGMAEELHGQRFEQVDTLAQEAMLKSVHDGKPAAATELWRQMNVERFWSLLVADCAAVYYAHPWAWDEIGFGGPAYPRGYMRLEEGEAEPWEVEERRYTWEPPANTLSGKEEASGTGSKHQTTPGQGGTH